MKRTPGAPSDRRPASAATDAGSRVTRDPDSPLVARVIGMAVGMALIFLGAWAGTYSALTLPKPYVDAVDSPVNRLLEPDAASNGRKIHLEIEIDDDKVSGTVSIATVAADPLFDADVRALLRDNPGYADLATGRLGVNDSWGTGWAYWQRPLIERRRGDEGISVRFDWVADAPAGEIERFITYAPPDGGETRVTVRAKDGWVVTDVSPFAAAEVRGEESVAIVSDRAVRIYLADTDRGYGPGGSWLDRSRSVWALWTLAPALAFFVALRGSRKRSPAGLQAPREWRGIGPLLAAALLIPLAQILVQFEALRRGPVDPESTLWIGWYVAVFGTACLTSAAGWGLGFHEIRPSSRRSRVASTALLLSGGGLAITVAVLLLLRTVGVADRIEGASDVWWDLAVEWAWLVGAVVLLWLGAGTFIVSLRGRYVAAGAVAAAGWTLPLMYWVQPQFDPGMWAHMLAVIVVVLVISGVAMYVTRWTMPGTPLARRRRWVVGGVAAVTLALTAPRRIVVEESVASSAALAIQELLEWPLAFGIIFVIIAGMVRARSIVGRLGAYAAMVVASVLLFRPYETYYGVPVAMLVGLAVLWWTGLERKAADRRVFTTGPDELTAGIRGVIRSAVSHRLDREHARNAATELTGGTNPQPQFDQKKTSVLDRITAPAPSPAGPSPLRWGGMPHPLRRAGVGALVATVVGIPFALPSLRYLFEVSDDAAGAMTLVQFVDAVVALRFPLYGFAFALLLPMLRGRFAIAKALRLAVTLALSEALVILIPFTWDEGSGEALLLRLSQILAVFLGLGAYFDYRSLRAAGYGLSLLPELYGANPRTVWSSGVVVTLISAAGSAFFASASDVLMQTLGR